MDDLSLGIENNPDVDEEKYETILRIQIKDKEKKKNDTEDFIYQSGRDGMKPAV